MLEGYSASIALAKLIIDLGINVSAITYMQDQLNRVPEKIIL